MKIAFLNIYQGKVSRGLETYIHEVASRLSVDHKVLVTTQLDGDKSFIYEPIKVKHKLNWDKRDSSGSLQRRLFIDYWSIQIALFTLKLIPALWKENPEIILPLNGGWQPAIIRIFTWIRGGKMVISGQSGLGWDDRNNLWSFPNCFVVLTDYQKNWAKRVNPFVQVVKIPNGVDTKVFQSNGDKIDFGIPRPIILYTAALSNWKRQELAIRAISELENGSLLLVGKGSHQNHLQQLGNKMLNGRFRITSYPYNEMPSVYRSADLFTYPTSKDESFGIAIAEAMASGLGVVATDDPIRREIVGDAGIFVDPTDTAEYTKALNTALQKNWGEKPRKQAEKFSWDNIAKQYNDLFVKLLK